MLKTKQLKLHILSYQQQQKFVVWNRSTDAQNRQNHCDRAEHLQSQNTVVANR